MGYGYGGYTSSGDEVLWYENSGSATFTKRTISSSVSGARATAFGDLDGDGDLDLLATEPNSNKVLWFRAAFGGYTWDGSNNNTFSSTGNGATPGIPGKDVNVTIPSSQTYYPTIITNTDLTM